jgi:hypothetical protein
MLIGTTNMNGLLSHDFFVPRKNICWNIRTNKVTKMDGPIRVGESRSDKELFHRSPNNLKETLRH